MSELMHAIVLLAHFHSLASFVFGCGVTSETDHPDGHVYSSLTDTHNDVDNDEDCAVNGHTALASEVFYYTQWLPTWKTWKSLGISHWSGKSQGNCGLPVLYLRQLR